MISLSKILVPTDFSEHSAQAMRYGAELAAKFGAELHLLYVIETIPYMIEQGAFVPPETEADMEAAAVKQLDGLKMDAATDLNVVRKANHGSPFVEIVRYTKNNEMDLIVLGTHGWGVITHMLLGSVAEKVVRKAPCPVLTVRAGEHDFVMP